MQKIIAQFTLPGMTSKQYDQVMKDLAIAGQEQPQARLYHVASDITSGWYVIDIWESAEALNEFAGTLMPILVKNGVTPPTPAVIPVYNIVAGSLVTG
jgi:hypothetical protein